MSKSNKIILPPYENKRCATCGRSVYPDETTCLKCEMEGSNKGCDCRENENVPYKAVVFRVDLNYDDEIRRYTYTCQDFDHKCKFAEFSWKTKYDEWTLFPVYLLSMENDITALHYEMIALFGADNIDVYQLTPERVAKYCHGDEEGDVLAHVIATWKCEVIKTRIKPENRKGKMDQIMKGHTEHKKKYMGRWLRKHVNVLDN